jgi:uncharacterized protein YndB with AHSA1/START domain
MPTFDDTTDSSAPPEEVWKALHDPERFPEWWVGLERVRVGDETGDGRAFTLWPDGWPDYPMPQALATDVSEGRVTVSCMISDLVFEWRLAPAAAGGTQIAVHVEIPEREAARMATQRAVIAASLRRLAEVAEATAAPRARG